MAGQHFTVIIITACEVGASAGRPSQSLQGDFECQPKGADLCGVFVE